MFHRSCVPLTELFTNAEIIRTIAISAQRATVALPSYGAEAMAAATWMRCLWMVQSFNDYIDSNRVIMMIIIMIITYHNDNDILK